MSYDPFELFYDLRVLPKFNWINFFANKRDNEEYGFVRIPVKELTLQSNSRMLEHLLYWFDNYAFKNIKWHKFLLKETTSANFPPYYEFYLKLSWLSKIFLTEGFKYPIGVFWYPKDNNIDDVYANPHRSEGAFIIHPGRGRQHVLDLFAEPDTEVDCLAFGTAGKKINFIEKFTTPEEFKKFIKDSYDMIPAEDVFTATKGTVIPHPIFQKHSINVNLLEDSLASLRYTLQNYNVLINVKEIIIPSTGKNKLDIVVNDPHNTHNIIKAILLLPYHDVIPQEILSYHGIKYVT